MPAYVIGQIQMRDPSWMEEYGAKIQLILRKYHGRYLVRTLEMEHMEGDLPLPTAIVLLEFPSRDHARNFYSDPEYAPLIELRKRGSDVDLVLVDGL